MPGLPPLLLTRPAEASARFAEEWRTRVGAEAPVLIAPLMEIALQPLEVDRERFAGLIFTSQNGVTAVGRAGRLSRAWCVGARTAEAASRAGYRAISADGDADDLVAAILASGERGPLLHVRGQEARGDVAGRLARAGVACEEVVGYRQRALPLSDAAKALLAGSSPVLVPLFSPNSARRFAEALAGTTLRAPLLIAALSPAVADAWNGPAPRCVTVADRPDASAMLEALIAAGDAP